ncbi:MAG TPA: hypothetical protein P5254_05285 [Aquihabitans sp.]|nr:hypothetical protein [Aquihabitans sp.]
MAPAGPARAPLLAAAASAGAGLIHIAAAGAEHDRPSAAFVLMALGIAQATWGAMAASRPASRDLRRVGIALAVVALVGWASAVTVGLPAPAALAEPMEPAVPDVVAAGLAVAVLASLGRRALAPDAPAPQSSATAVGVAVVAVLALGAVAATPAAHEARRADAAADAARDEAEAAALADAGVPDVTTTTLRTRIGPYDPERPLDLSDIAGVTTQQQQGAEDLVAAVLAASSEYPSAEEAEAAGYVSIGDDFTGEEHLIDWSAVLDPATLDPSHPEALVFDVADDGSRTLAAVMFVLPPSTRVDDAPQPGGPLTSWHLHGELCIDEARTPPAAVATTDASGECPTGLDEAQPAPTLHVWVTRHPCGPFSELEGVGTDPASIASGCEHRHG